MDAGVYSNTEGLVGKAVEAMLPQIRPKSSLINSIYELKDLKTIPETMKRCNNAINAINRIISGERWGKRTLRAILKGGSDVVLQKNFNVEPLLQDIANTVFSIKRVNTKLKQLRDEAGQVQTHHWGADLFALRNLSERYSASAGNYVSNPSQVSIQRSVDHSVRRFTATMSFFYKMPSYSDAETRIRGIADYNGLVLSPQVIWNAIPWSFVVDWVIGIGPWLSQFNGRQLQIVTHIIEFGYSVHVNRVVETSLGGIGQVAHIEEESYFRTPSTVPLVSSIQLSGLNPNEFSLATALGGSR
jgi:hypothetical protein